MARTRIAKASSIVHPFNDTAKTSLISSTNLQNDPTIDR
jgi:hypothetical protein